MDHVSANKMLSVQERENISGCRVFDGEDQGKYINYLMNIILNFIGAGNRYKM